MLWFVCQWHIIQFNDTFLNTLYSFRFFKLIYFSFLIWLSGWNFNVICFLFNLFFNCITFCFKYITNIFYFTNSLIWSFSLSIYIQYICFLFQLTSQFNDINVSPVFKLKCVIVLVYYGSIQLIEDVISFVCFSIYSVIFRLIIVLSWIIITCVFSTRPDLIILPVIIIYARSFNNSVI